jgi:hypothetical protein
MLRVVTGRGGVAAGLAGWPGGSCPPAEVFCVVCGCPSRCAVSGRAVRLYVVINRVLPGTVGWRPGPDSAQSSSGHGAAGLPMVPASCKALRACGLVPPPGGSLRGARGLPRGTATSRGRQNRGGAAGRDLPGRDARHPTSGRWWPGPIIFPSAARKPPSAIRPCPATGTPWPPSPAGAASATTSTRPPPTAPRRSTPSAAPSPENLATATPRTRLTPTHRPL